MNNTWGSLGDVAFQFLTSPVRGSVQKTSTAKFTEHSRIVTRKVDGLHGQKPLMQISGLALSKYTFRLKISDLVLSKISLSTFDKIALAAGAAPIAKSALGDVEEDKSFYVGVDDYVETLDTMLAEQGDHGFFIGDKFCGYFVITDLVKDRIDAQDGNTKIANISISLTEWIEP